MNKLILIAGLLSFLNLTWYAIKVWTKKAGANSIASWLMWVCLDSVILGCTLATGKPYALALSYVAGASFVLIAQFKRGTWTWTGVETFSAIGATIATILWQTIDPAYGVGAGVIAMTLAGIPLMRFMWNNPDPTSFWMFANTVIACILTLVALDTWSIGGALLPAGGLLFNGYMAIIVLRKKKNVAAIPAGKQPA